MRFHAAIDRYRLSRRPGFKTMPAAGATGCDDGRDDEDHMVVIDMRDTAALYSELHISNSQNLEDEVHDTLQAFYEIA